MSRLSTKQRRSGRRRRDGYRIVEWKWTYAQPVRFRERWNHSTKTITWERVDTGG